MVSVNAPTKLYKYRAVNKKTLDALRQDMCWFSNRAKLNDPYDCSVRLPKAIRADEVRRVLKIAMGRFYSPTGKSRSDLLASIETSADSFERLGLMAEYAENGDLLNVLRDPSSVQHASDLLWFGSYSVVARFFAATTVLCLSESPDNQVMWSDYAEGHHGFCIGYRIRSAHPLATRLRRVAYSANAAPVDFGLAVEDPVATRDAHVCCKSLDWAFQKEWRVTVAGEPSLRDAPLEMVEIIFGSSMLPRERKEVEDTLSSVGASVTFREVRTAYKRGYDLTIVDC
jgi:hypothetical protein